MPDVAEANRGTEHGAGRSSAHVPFMDGLRAVAIVLVVTYHANEAAMLSNVVTLPGLAFELPQTVLKVGHLGVELFFFISGFCLFYSYARAARAGAALPTLGHYVARRFWKIVPSYFLALTFITLFLTPPFPPGASLLAHYVAHLFFLHGFNPDTFTTILGPLWSLAVEVEFYVMFPLLALAFVRRPELALAATIVASISYRVYLDATQLSGIFWWAYQVPDFLDVFGFGMYAAHILCKFETKRPFVLRDERFCTAAALVSAAIVWGFFGNVLSAGGGPPVWKLLNDTRDCYALLFFVFTVGTAFGAAWLRNVLALPLLVFLSTISYNLYLWNRYFIDFEKLTVYPLVQRLPYAATLLGFFAIAAPVAIASVVTYAVERPLLRRAWSLPPRFLRALSVFASVRSAALPVTLLAAAALLVFLIATSDQRIAAFVIVALWLATIGTLARGSWGRADTRR